MSLDYEPDNYLILKSHTYLNIKAWMSFLEYGGILSPVVFCVILFPNE